ncbi:hypothetical protein TWF970_005052 [Orbilia oligospora]|uniref:Fe2OG dioxygenase domain-containing protein n=1 Tax=Orbilia oligospora TaxID=2813651 RepID=A0A7C8R945_ORBOL|nr:hypothetical protein TWF970_005052 [Orbilia oligospora]
MDEIPAFIHSMHMDLLEGEAAMATMSDGDDENMLINEDLVDDDEQSNDERTEAPPPSFELRLYRALEDFENYQGTFAFSSTYSAVPNPGLKVKGLDGSCLRLPVSTEDAVKLSELGKLSPFGKGEQTIIDPTVRSSRQLDPSELEFENPRFTDWLQGPVLSEIGTALGIGTEMRSKLNLYKLLVYEKGDHFKTHRDTPKEDGMIGTVVVILPSVFEGGIVKLSHAGQEMSFDFARDCNYSFGVAAWYSDVEHAVEEVTGGYRVALVYNLTVEGGSLSASGTAVRLGLLELLEELKEREDPVAYSLENKYSLAQRRLGFKGKDRYVISNLIAGMNKVGGISMCCGDVQIKLSEDEEEMDENYENEDEDEAPNFNRTRGVNAHVEIILTGIEHIAGTYRHFGSGQIPWLTKLYSLGPSLDEIESINQEEEYTGNEGTLIHTWYKTSCIILWPTSEAESIVQQIKEPLLQWDTVLNIVSPKSPPLTTAGEGDPLLVIKLLAFLERCICFPPPDDKIQRAGELLYSMFQSVGKDDIEMIEKSSLFEYANLVAPWRPVGRGVEPVPNPSKEGLLRLLKLKALFPKNLPISFDPTVKKILGLRYVVLSPSVLCKLLETYQDTPQEEVIELFESTFTGHPNVNLLEDLYKKVENGYPNGSPVHALLNSIPHHTFHEFIIAGLRQRFALYYAETEDFRFRLDQSGFSNDYHPMGYSVSNTEATSSSIWQGIDPSINRITNYLRFLDEQAEPHRSRLITLFTDAILIPLEKMVSVSDDEMQRWRRYLSINVQVVEKFLRKPSLTVLPCSAIIRENMVEAIIKYFPCDKPEPASYFLPSWTSPRCPTGGCEICGPINQFLQSNTEHHYHVQVSEEESDHYRRLDFELSNYPNPQATRLYEYRSEINVRYHDGYALSPANFTIIKLAEERYRKTKRQYDATIKARKDMLKLIQEPFNQFGKIAREVGDSFSPSVESEGSTGNNTTGEQAAQMALADGFGWPIGGDYEDDDDDSDEESFL